MSTTQDHTPNLSSDIQRALQQAVGEVNNAFTQSQDITSSRKKRTRSDSTNFVPVDVSQKKHKKKKNADDPSVSTAQPNQQSSTKDKKKKKKKKDKGKAKAKEVVSDTVQVNNHSPQLVEETSDNHSLDFLNAVVAAASATADAHHLDVSPYQAHSSYQDHHIMPNIHNHDAPPPFMPYPPMTFPFSAPAHPYGQSSSANLLPNLGFPLPDFQFASNDEIIRALQDLDVSKLAGVLKTLGDAAAAANVPMNIPGFVPPPLGHPNMHPPPPPQLVGQPPSTSGIILNTAPKSTRASHKRVLDMSLPGPDHGDPDHAHMLANKWMNAAKLAELVKTHGLVYKKGKFSAIEEEQLRAAIENFRVSRGLTDEQVQDIIFQKNEKGGDNTFWSEITSAIALRPIIAVYHHVRRAFHPKKQQGKWMPEEDAVLKQAVTDLGQQWEKVSEIVGRMSSDCRDRYRNHIANRDVRMTGAWTKEEEAELTKIVTGMTIQQGKDIDNDVFWGLVSDRMGNRRGRQQCRIKWTDSLSKMIKNEGQKPRWSAQDAYILVHKVDSMNVRDDTEIDWKTLPDIDWNLWSAHSLQRRWLTMKRGIKGYEDMTHQEIMDILRVKKAHLPPAARKRRVTSAAIIEESEPGEAGPSTGKGTREAQNSVSDGQDRDADGSTEDSDV
ncbi:hypothetical protein K503DRAFT_764917 [Rhizopogon vinicolor AM-OR11-026]|uniref:Uncharacterized protein n=1 Tax=Rhizopogon vinicolor AM-OR11-026 TaxID=1314800 RepID=A0A1B7NIB4_9AGAM|nr:hypothetical protein K503DRAFT_764917 [Rhizopogon vinicolor AM-OR11-026]